MFGNIHILWGYFWDVWKHTYLVRIFLKWLETYISCEDIFAFARTWNRYSRSILSNIRPLILLRKSFNIRHILRGHSLIACTRKSKCLILSFCEYATVHFVAYPPSYFIHAYTKRFIVKEEKLSTPLCFAFILSSKSYHKEVRPITKDCAWVK